jgi:hypothetical protein
MRIPNYAAANAGRRPPQPDVDALAKPDLLLTLNSSSL